MDHYRSPGSDNLTDTEKAEEYNLAVELNGARFWFRSEAARKDFVATFRALDAYRSEPYSIVVLS